MFEGSQFAVKIEGICFVGNGVIKITSLFNFVKMISYGSKGVLTMFKHVVADNKVKSIIFDSSKFFTIVNNIYVSQGVAI
jgi:hypothetical protein